MQTDLLETFLDLCETRSFHRSAERLGVTQSTVSARIAALEAALGARLFLRSRAGTDLTPEGHRFAPHARNLRHEWTEAQRHVQASGPAAQRLRLGIQNDLAAEHIGRWVADFRRALPEASFYLQPDYSTQMCADLLEGQQDFAVLFSPRPHPDLYFEPLGEVPYVMVSSDPASLPQIRAERFIFAQVSPVFEALHRAVTPHLATAPVAVGQGGTVAALLTAMGGAGYVLAQTAETLCASGFHRVVDAPVLRQPVYAALHVRHRIAPLHRRLARIIQRRLASG